jgi:hypothetical protein
MSSCSFANIQVDKNSSDKIEVNNDVMIPINNVVAKPLIGPEPNINNTAPKMCVTFASVIDDIAPLQL